MFPSRLVMQINFVCIQHVQSGENMAAMGVYTFIASKSIYATQVGLQLLFSPLGSDIVMRTACCSVGVVLPVYSTLKPIETKDQDEQHKWLIYGLNPYLSDPLTSASKGQKSGNGMVSKFPVDHEINSKIYLWRGNPWNLELDAVVNSTNENLDEAHSSPGLHAAAGPGLAEECATRGGCRTGMTKVTHAYLQEGHTYCKT